MVNTTEFSYIPSAYLSLILKTAINNAWTDTDDWSLAMVGHLLFNHNMIDVFDYDDISFIDFNFIKNEYQWLYVYQLFAHAYQVIHKLPPIIDGEALKLFDAERAKEFPSDMLKNCAKLFLNDFLKIATLPNLENEWLSLFKYLHDNRLSWGDINHPTANQIIYDAKQNQLFDELGNIVKWYDILNIQVSPNTPISNFKLHTSKNNSPHLISSVQNSDWKCTYLLGGYDV